MTAGVRWGRSGLMIPSIAALAGLAVLLSLGTWQLQRLAWKERLIAGIETRSKAMPVNLAEALALPEKDYVRVSVSGTYLPAASQRMYHVEEGVLGWKILAPFKTASGQELWVDRGFAPDQEKGAFAPPADEQNLLGALRVTYMPQGLFTPDNAQAERRWYWFDQISLDRSVKVKTLPGILLQLEAPDHQNRWPRARPVSPKLSNKHFGYALTWFGLAITLLGVYMAFVLQHRRKTSSS